MLRLKKDPLHGVEINLPDIREEGFEADQYTTEPCADLDIMTNCTLSCLAEGESECRICKHFQYGHAGYSCWKDAKRLPDEEQGGSFTGYELRNGLVEWI